MGGHFVRFDKMAAQYVNIADFYVIYTQEVHPTDGWAFKPGEHPYEIATHKVIKDRIEAAKILQGLANHVKVVADDISDVTALTYGGVYERIYIIQDSKVLFQGAIWPIGYNLDKINQVLDKIK